MQSGQIVWIYSFLHALIQLENEYLWTWLNMLQGLFYVYEHVYHYEVA